MKVKRIKRRKFNFKKFFKFLFFLSVLVIVFYFVSRISIKNIIVKGNNYVSDETIIETAGIEDYPSFFETFFINIPKKINKIPLIKESNIKRKWGFIVLINVTEYKVLFQIRSTGEFVIDNGEKLKNQDIYRNIPVLINYVPDEILDKMIKKFSAPDENVILKISEIEYTPTTYDDERYIFYLNDGNEVYVTLNKLDEFNNYTKIKKQLGDKKGILYLDSGNYFEIKE